MPEKEADGDLIGGLAPMAPDVAGAHRCPSCGLVTPPSDGPADPYDASSPGCWEMFGRLHLTGTSQLATDTYLAQHPGLATPAGRRSVLTHLVGLRLALHGEESPRRVRQLLGVVFPDKTLDPPEISAVPDLRGPTVADVIAAVPEERQARETDWAWWVWGAWSAEHRRVAELAELARRRLR